MIKIDGLWWPDTDKRGQPAIVRECKEAVPVVMSLVPHKGVCVQAGGNVGAYPLALAGHFERVVTFEPDRDNLACLRKNVTASNVSVFHAALGKAEGRCSVAMVEPDNCGAHKVIRGDDTDMMTIDGLGLDACDLIWLDIEGHEAQAIEGAKVTIERFKPIIVLEEKGLGPKASPPGYSVAGRIGNDTIYRRP
jgi:FkbM family methyltransferase